MGLAPTPGARAEPKTFRIRVKERTLEFPANITIGEKFVVRTSTGLPFEAFWGGEGRIGEDSVCVLWWLARRANGEPQLSWQQNVADWPAPLGADDLDMSIVGDDEDDDDDPGKSEPA